jgi:hypothetical protein
MHKTGLIIKFFGLEFTLDKYLIIWYNLKMKMIINFALGIESHSHEVNYV